MDTGSEFRKEGILPGADLRSPFYINVPDMNARPIDDLVKYFKLWKHFIRSLIFYLKEICMSKEFTASLNSQLINSVQFPGCKDLPYKYLTMVENQKQQTGSGTPTKELKKSLSNSSLVNLGSTSSGPTAGNNSYNAPPSQQGNSGSSTEKRPGLFKTKSNNSTFLKTMSGGSSTSSSNGPHHGKRNASFSSATNLFKNFPMNGSGVSLPYQHNNSNVLHHLNDVHVPPEYFPDNSVFTNLAPILINNHYHIYSSQMRTVKELNGKLIPKLETLLKNLSSKIKEIKSSLKNESFANKDLAREVSQTGQILNAYMQSVERYSSSRPVLKRHTDDSSEEDEGVMDDPFLLKLKVDDQLKNQLIQENYLFASYLNLQNISKELLSYVLKELASVTERFGKLLNQEILFGPNSDHAVIGFLFHLKNTIQISTDQYWIHFITMNKNFLNVYEDTPYSKKKDIRNMSKVVIPYGNSVHNKCVRSGIIYKKSKILKNYSGNFYLLTCNYLHEFKIDNENNAENANSAKKGKDKITRYIKYDDFPTKSYNLNEYVLKSKDPKNFKFVLQKASNFSKKFTFKCKGPNDYENWYNDLSDLLRFGESHLARFKCVEKKSNEREAHKKKQPEGNKEKEVPEKSPQSEQNPSNSDFKSDDQSVNTNDTPATIYPPSNKDEELRLTLNNIRLNETGPQIVDPITSIGNVSGSTGNFHSVNNSIDSAQKQFMGESMTPTAHTPSSAGSFQNERNPFENTFTRGEGSAASSPGFSPNIVSGSGIPLSPPIIGAQKAATSHQQQHEAYLNIQREFLRQQQDILDLKIKQSELESEQRHQILDSNSPQMNVSSSSPDMAQFPLGSPRQTSISRVSSNDSVNSMIHQSQLQHILNTNRDLIQNMQHQHGSMRGSIDSRHALSTDSLLDGVEPVSHSVSPQKESFPDQKTPDDGTSHGVPKVFISDH
ncbi:Piso0_000623 [Millerozyma farinosa CBS 7064]|uniref:Piso0_000623 protein n=1 Tax=Pichia sorbitophila (strain ATCC MYA-4447 / BCRC 22081 / CBS 7064 / NBRC 10061 / NRRL Y-12695) TaxID=559304 RepID=G8YR24_PICSO|nr:Piso0_000623 [Millerozyma farinosa CBS 7064]